MNVWDWFIIDWLVIDMHGRIHTQPTCSRAPVISVACLGNALGGGAELSTACDFRVMARGSKVQFVQARMGVSCGWGGTSRLVRVRARGGHGIDFD